MPDLPTIWAGLLALAVFLYVILDGFDLGVGILFPFAKDAKERDQMLGTIAPVWDGNETWLVLGGGGLLAVFPGAYAVVMPAFYTPILIMLIALVFRGVAFEFRHHGRERGKKFWTGAFFAGSLAATIGQGLVLGGFIQGVNVVDGAFAGGPFDWLTPFSILVAGALVGGYALLGAAWLVFKAEGPLHDSARAWSRTLALTTGFAMAGVSLATLSMDPAVTARWGITMRSVDWPQFLQMAPLPLGAAACVAGVMVTVKRTPDIRPYLFSVGLFALGFLGLAVSLWPYIVPFALTPQQAAGPDNALTLMLWGAVIFLPMVLGYTAWAYWVFRAKVGPDAAYH